MNKMNSCWSCADHHDWNPCLFSLHASSHQGLKVLDFGQLLQRELLGINLAKGFPQIFYN
jgi:hypothetical protein